MDQTQYLMPLFQWDANRTSSKLTLSEDRLNVMALEGNGFKSAIGDKEFIPGHRYYFELRIEKGNLIKIGVCTANAEFQDVLSAFSDTDEGWAIYNGELRHNSNSKGDKYGAIYKKSDIIGVFVNMVEGTLAFSVNGSFLGIAFEDERLKSTPLYAAIAPIYKADGVTLMMELRED